MAAICRRVPAHAPTTVHEALQHYWFIHLGVVTELNPWDSFNPGRLDQSLYPLYKKTAGRGDGHSGRSIRNVAVFLGEIQQPSFSAQSGGYG